jgi:Holliday junction resolvase RusA-like endonuclease
VIEFEVSGQPVPQGSMKVINGHIIHTRGSALAAWRSAIALEARRAGAFPTRAPIVIHMTFYMVKPRTVKRLEPSVPPDLDKLIRAVLDALTATAYTDDGQVVEIHAKKTYGEFPKVSIKITEKIS